MGRYGWNVINESFNWFVCNKYKKTLHKITKTIILNHFPSKLGGKWMWFLLII